MTEQLIDYSKLEVKGNLEKLLLREFLIRKHLYLIYNKSSTVSNYRE